MLIKKDNLKFYAREYAGGKGYKLSEKFHKRLLTIVQKTVEQTVSQTIDTGIERAKKNRDRKTVMDYDI